jgi:hypothetical protein
MSNVGTIEQDENCNNACQCFARPQLPFDIEWYRSVKLILRVCGHHTGRAAADLGEEDLTGRSSDKEAPQLLALDLLEHLCEQLQTCRDFLQDRNPVLLQGPNAPLPTHNLIDAWASVSIKRKYTLILDLDLTLIYALKVEPSDDEKPQVRPSWNCDAQIKGKGLRFTWDIWFRKGLYEFLQATSRLYEIVVFSNSMVPYVRAVVEEIDPRKSLINFFIGRPGVSQYQYSTCNQDRELSELEGEKTVIKWTKDIAWLFQRNTDWRPERVVIIDDLVSNYPRQLDNVIPILPFDAEALDDDLLAIVPVLQELAAEDDVRVKLKDIYNLSGRVMEQQ